jgi:hypothetical protein
MREQAMPGFEASNLMGWIAAVGALRAFEATHGEAVRLVWRPRGDGWQLTALAIEHCDAAAAAVYAWIKESAAAWDWAGYDNAVMTPAAWAEAAGASEGLAAELWAAIGSDGCVRRDGRIQASKLEYAQGGGHQHWLASLRGAVHRVAAGALTPADLTRVLWQNWHEQDGGLICRWDWRCERDHALMAEDPAGRGNSQRQDHAATALAAIGLASLPTAPAARGLSGPLVSSWDRDILCWPIWTVPMSLAEIEALVCARALQQARDLGARRELAARGVGAVMAARRWYAGKLIVFGRGRERART